MNDDPTKPAAPTINAVTRAIVLLRALNRQPVSTIDVLFRQTGIPKPSIVRLLRTFEAEGLVRHAPQYGAYVLTSGVDDLACGYHSEPRIVEAVAPVADALTAEIKWPVAVGVLDTDALVVRYSTIPLSPLSLLHSSIGMRLSLVNMRTGRPSGMTAHTATWLGIPRRDWMRGSWAVASVVMVPPKPSWRAAMSTFHANG